MTRNRIESSGTGLGAASIFLHRGPNIGRFRTARAEEELGIILLVDAEGMLILQ
ncbi:hypothetical protein [Dapis sp. BLCC M126]|uniref:hypothetical protein n=1 Tax=Dapis sp. BLCC M126 TaxID=3400189 RepID=UPI003CEBEEDF